MSLIVAIKDKDRVVFGSDKQVSTSVTKDHSATKIWEVADLPGAIMGSVGSMRASQVIQYSRLFDLNEIMDKGGISTSFVINSLVPNIVAQLRSAGALLVPPPSDDNEIPCATIPNMFLFALGESAWMIWTDLSVTELDDYLAIGSGSDVATGVLFATKEKNPFERIVTCIDAAAETTLFVDDGVDLLATKYYPRDRQQIAKALDIDLKVIDVEKDNEVEHIEEDKKKIKESKNKKETKPTKKEEKKNKKDK